MKKILIVDDNKYIRFALSVLMEQSGYNGHEVGEGEKVIAEVKSKNPDLVILDKKLPGYDGLDLLVEIKKIRQELPVIILTAYGDEKTRERALELGADVFMTKPFDNDEIISTIERLLK
ncbi:MAG TPA: response regulator [Ignavibacteria bacterium]|nr:response regulator [Ignavibacteria bacterium]